MNQIEDLYELALALNDGNPFNPNDDLENVRDVVEALVDLGNTPHVSRYHDDHLGLVEQLPEAFLNTPLDELEDYNFELEIGIVLEQANRIIKLSKREISEDDLEEIDSI